MFSWFSMAGVLNSSHTPPFSRHTLFFFKGPPQVSYSTTEGRMRRNCAWFWIPQVMRRRFPHCSNGRLCAARTVFRSTKSVPRGSQVSWARPNVTDPFHKAQRCTYIHWSDNELNTTMQHLLILLVL
ncbi:hypothetical protein FKM82_004995 [Ascaphus truei]